MRVLSTLLRCVLLVPLLAACGGHTGDTMDGGNHDAARDTFFRYDVSSSDAAGCGLVTCASAHATCGSIGDGCGGVIQCGDCAAPQTCGGGGVPSQCGGMAACVPHTCATAGATCGPIGDGCGGMLECGTCTAPDSCGGGDAPSQCGHSGAGGGDGGSSCAPRTCASVGANCGPVADGCGGMLSCGMCSGADTCGGGGTPSVCGHRSACVPRTCAMAGANCGPVADGCGALLNCGMCAAPQICGGSGVPSVCGAGSSDGGVTCTGLCLRQVHCPSGTTTVTGTVYAPNGIEPLPNAVVYVPNAPVAAFAPGVTCDRCGASVSGSPLVTATTGADGRFTLTNVPTGANIPVVIQLGRWRRQVVIPNVTACTATAMPASLTHLPRNHTEGDIPLMAMVTGNVDVLECVIRKIGIDDSEFTTPAGGGRVQFYVANGANAPAGGAPRSTTLMDNPATLGQYDMVLFSCEGMPINKPASEQANLINYANAGGRVFATHFSYTWLYNDAPFSTTAVWNPEQTHPGDPLTGLIDTSFPRGVVFSQWLTLVGASTRAGQISISAPRHDLDGVVAPSQRWIYSSRPNTVQHYTFNTPVGTAPALQCGRVLFSDFHVNNATNASGMRFPAECSGGGLTAQEKVLEFMLFDLSSCIAPDMPGSPTCTPQTCASSHANCGPIGDGCGAMLNCGMCTAPDTCGGGGTPSVCGHTSCTPRTCADQGINCGPAGDGCGGLLACGMCTAPDTCGGGGTPGQCGHMMTCTPRTCAAQGIGCGPAGDGCGAALDCGPCTAPDTCGGGGTPGQCGHSACVPRTCADAHATCGPIGDGCGGTVDCGTCTPPQTCGGGGTPNVCGAIG